MKKTLFLLAAVLLVITGCKKPTQPAQPKQHEFVYDKYGVVQRIDTTEKNVYLVFTAHFSTNDNGEFENMDGLESVLNTLKEKNIKGSFFPTGACYREPKYTALIHRIIDEGHYLSHHSSKHLLLCPEDGSRDTVNLCTEDSIREDIAEMEALMKEFGLEKKDYPWMIPPYEVYNQFSADVLRDCGYQLLNPTQATLVTGNDWCEKGHHSYKTGDELLAQLWEVEKNETLNGAIILIHAMHYPNRQDADRMYTRLGEIIDHLTELGYGFKSVKDL